MELFGTSGIRGHAEEFFTPQFTFDLGRTFATYLKKNHLGNSVALGNDPRLSSPKIKKDFARGLFYEGVEIFDEGVTPIPSINWLIKNVPIKAGVMITGSHIAPELNGLKFFAHNEEISVEDEKNIEEIYAEIREKTAFEEIEPEIHLETRARELYSEMLFSLVKNSLPSWRVALDCANGAQSTVIPHLLKRLGLRVVEVNCNPQNDFIARDTDAEDKAVLEEVKSTVKNEDCDFGIAFDGDGDRAVFIDENGKFIQGEYSCSLVAKSTPGNALVTTISASQVVETLGKKVYRTKVGSPYVIGKMKEVGASFGFEQNGGAISPEIMYTRDGGTMAIKMLNLFSSYKGTFSEIVHELEHFYMFRTKVDYKWELKEEILSKAKDRFKGVKIEEMDGLKIWLTPDTWLLFRSSANAPEFRVFAESKDKEKAEKLLEDGLRLVNEVIRNDKS